MLQTKRTLAGGVCGSGAGLVRSVLVPEVGWAEVIVTGAPYWARQGELGRRRSVEPDEQQGATRIHLVCDRAGVATSAPWRAVDPDVLTNTEACITARQVTVCRWSPQ